MMASSPGRWRRLHMWFVRLRLPGWQAALVGALAGLLVGGAITFGMVRHAVFTGAHQSITASAVLLTIWLCIGLFAGLTVLAPLPEHDPRDQAMR